MEFYTLLLKALPFVVVNVNHEGSNNKLGYSWNGVLLNVFTRIQELYNPKSIDSRFQDILVKVTGNNTLYVSSLLEVGKF